MYLESKIPRLIGLSAAAASALMIASGCSNPKAEKAEIPVAQATPPIFNEVLCPVSGYYLRENESLPIPISPIVITVKNIGSKAIKIVQTRMDDYEAGSQTITLYKQDLIDSDTTVFDKERNSYEIGVKIIPGSNDIEVDACLDPEDYSRAIVPLTHQF